MTRSGALMGHHARTHTHRALQGGPTVAPPPPPLSACLVCVHPYLVVDVEVFFVSLPAPDLHHL
jgi:hypothetical protein